MSEPAVQARQLTRRFGAFTAVDRLDLQVEHGEIFGFLGSNGAGKTTAIRVFCGLLPPTSGEARVLGIDVAADPEAVKRRIGYMSQRFSLYQDLSVHHNLRFFGGVYGLRGRDLADREEWALEMTGLQGKENLLTGDLPGGWKQRLALACAVLHRPEVVFLDEPTGSVDPISRRQFWRLIAAMSEEGVTVFVTTHYMDEAERCRRLSLMHSGVQVAVGSIPELKTVFGQRRVLEVRCPDVIEGLRRLGEEPWVLETSVFGTRIHAVVGPDAAAREIAQEGSDRGRAETRIRELLEDGDATVQVQEIVPSLEDVFIHHIERQEEINERLRSGTAGADTAGSDAGRSPDDRPSEGP